MPNTSSLLNVIKNLGFNSNEFSLKEISGNIGLPYPISIKGMIWPQTLQFFSGEMNANSIRCEAQLILNSVGFWIFKGIVRESAPIGDNYLCAALITGVKNPEGESIAFSQDGELFGLMNGPSEYGWEQKGHNPIIANKWHAIQEYGIQFKLRASTNPVEAIWFALLFPAVIGFFILTGASGSSKPVCDEIQPINSESGNSGIELKCRKEW